MKETFLKYLEEKYPLDFLDLEYILNDISEVVNVSDLKSILSEDNLSEEVTESINKIIDILNDNEKLSRYIDRHIPDNDGFNEDLYRY